jgi:hypothetical protein
LIENDSTPLTDANRPPPLVPFCASCDMPVEIFTHYPSVDDDYFILEASCHGRSAGVRIARLEAEQMLAMNAKLVLFQRREGFDAVK